MAEQNLMLHSALYLGAAVIAVPIAKRLGLGSVLGYLLAGVAIGPWGMRLIANVESIMHFAEFGVVLLLFLIGLELNPKRLWQMRRPILGLGGSQLLLSALLIAPIAMALGMGLNAALLVGLGLALSSTAIALQSLQERHLMSTPAGGNAFSILLFQDIAVIPLLMLIPLLAGSGFGGGGDPLMESAKMVAAIGAVIVGGHYLTRPVFHYIANTHLPEIFTAFTLLLVLGIALLMDSVGLSMALGSFLAGVLLAESEYRHELELEIRPFKGLLLGLFFISVGMSINFGLFFEHPLLVLGLTMALVAAKLLVLWLLALSPLNAIPRSQSVQFAILLAQGGEFAFVLFSVAAQAGLVDAQENGLLLLVVALSMVATPLLLLLHDRLIAPRLVRTVAPGAEEATPVYTEGEVIIAGFGRFGRVVGRLLHANDIPTTILDHDPEQIEAVRQVGYTVFYGDSTRLDTLRLAGADKARMLIITLDDPEEVLQVVHLAKKHFPHLKLLARAHDMANAMELMRLGVPLFQRELFEASLRLGEKALIELGYGAYRAHCRANEFRDHDRQLMHTLYGHTGLDRRVSVTRADSEELGAIFAADERELDRRREEGWE